MTKQKQGFTLVELIVVITILAILGTIAFISLQGYSRDARDSVRISDMKNIEKGFELEITKVGKLPKPEDSIEISASGTVISYQGYVGEKILGKIGVRGGGKDPLDENYYTYVSNANLTKYQILGYLESDEVVFNNNIIEVTNALDLSERFPTVGGNELGVLLDLVTKEPIQVSGEGVDVVNTNTGYIAYLNNKPNGIITGTGIILKNTLSHLINPIGSCNSILKNGNSKGDGTYKIDPENKGDGFDVYCDMSTNGGGWTKVVNYKLNILLNNISNSDVKIDSDNYFYLHSLRNNKNNKGKYEFIISVHKGNINKLMHFTQDNSYFENPLNNNFQKKSGDLTFQYNDTNWYGLALGIYGNASMGGSCKLALSYGSPSNEYIWWGCIIDTHELFGTGPLLTSLDKLDHIEIFQK